MMQTEGRYHRQEILPQFGPAAQQKLGAARVLVIGAGGLGCPVLQYLAAAGVGKLIIADGDEVSLSNLHRQVLFSMDDIGRKKAEAAGERLRLMNPEVEIEVIHEHVHKENIWMMVEACDVVADCSDNFPTRYLINDVCGVLQKPLVYGAVSGFEGQVAVFHVNGCGQYRDLFPEMPLASEVRNCAEAGVLGVLPGVIGTMMATELIKCITGIGGMLLNKILNYDALRQQFFTVDYQPGTSHKGPATREQIMETVYDMGCSRDLLQTWLADERSVLVDVRERSEQPKLDRYPHLSIPLNELEEKLSELRGSRVVLFCQTGVRSEKAARLLRQMGIEAYHLDAETHKRLYKESGHS